MANIKTRDRAIKAMELRIAGLQYAEIAKTLKYNSEQAAWKAVHDLLRRTEQDTAATFRYMQITRLDTALSSIWGKVLEGNEKAIGAFLKIEDRRARLLGLDRVTNLNIDLSDPNIPMEVLERIAAGDDPLEALTSVRVQPAGTISESEKRVRSDRKKAVRKPKAEDE